MIQFRGGFVHLRVYTYAKMLKKKPVFAFQLSIL